MHTDGKRLSKHSVPNLVITCIDFRFRGDMHKALLDTFGIDDFDEIKLAGGGGNLSLLGSTQENRKQTVLDDIALAVNAHKVENIYILTHQNCGAYATAGKAFPKELSTEEKDFHTTELEKAKALLAEKFPSVKVYTAFTHVHPESDAVLFLV